MHSDSVREELKQRVRARPFQRFVVTLDSGDKFVVEHPENMAFDPEPGGKPYVYIVSRGIVGFATLEKITHIAFIDEGQPTQR